MIDFTDWRPDHGRDSINPKNWHAYRARLINDQWDYEQRQIPRVAGSSSEGFLSWLNKPQVDLEQQTNSSWSDRALESVDEVEEDEEEEQQQGQEACDLDQYLPEASTFRESQLATSRPHHHSSKGKAKSVDIDLPFRPVSPQYYKPLADPRMINRAGAATAPPIRSHSKNKITRQSSKKEKDKYKLVHHSIRKDFFKPGRVFKFPWAASLDGTCPFAPGEVVRFFVVKDFHKHCLCVAIQTYGDMATIGQNPEHHMVVYGGENESPRLVPGESAAVLSHSPVKLALRDKKKHLSRASRLNLARLYNISHKTPMREVGLSSAKAARRVRKHCREVQGAQPDGREWQALLTSPSDDDA